jgi:hypothetical protein
MYQSRGINNLEAKSGEKISIVEEENNRISYLGNFERLICFRRELHKLRCFRRIIVSIIL